MGDHIQLTKKEDAKEKKNCNFPPYPEDVNHLSTTISTPGQQG